MKTLKEKIIWSVSLFLVAILGYNINIWFEKKISYNEFSGVSEGTSYTIKFIKENNVKITASEVDSIFKLFQNIYSITDENSTISKFNKTGFISIKHSFLYDCLEKNKELYELTDGAFDPTIGRLVTIWGANFDNIGKVDSNEVKNQLQYIGFNLLKFNKDSVWTEKEGVQLDLGATYRGQCVDFLANYMDNKGIANYMIETDWGARIKGKNRDKEWFGNLKKNNIEEAILSANISQVNYSVANAGYQYRFFVRDGKKFAYTLNPKTGYPSQTEILSAYIFADECMLANALSTACMALGLEKSKELSSKFNSIRFLLNYQKSETEIASFDSFATKQ
jgi:FAD:protein FMN transferase